MCHIYFSKVVWFNHHVYNSKHIYILRERERERERDDVLVCVEIIKLWFLEWEKLANGKDSIRLSLSIDPIEFLLGG